MQWSQYFIWVTGLSVACTLKRTHPIGEILRQLSDKSIYRTPVKSSRWQMFFKIRVLKNVAIFTGKHLCWSLFLMTSKKNYNTGVFLWILRNFKEYLFYRTPRDDCFRPVNGCFFHSINLVWYLFCYINIILLFWS